MSRRSALLNSRRKRGYFSARYFLLRFCWRRFRRINRRHSRFRSHKILHNLKVSSAQCASQTEDHASMPGMNMADEKTSERAAVNDMTPGHADAHSQHMYMTSMRERTPEDVARAGDIVTKLACGH